VAQTYEYYYDVYPINNGTQFWVELIDPRTFTNPTGCQVYLNRLPNGWPDFTSCGFAVPIQSWFPLQHTTSGYMVLATQTNRNDISPGVSNGCLNALEIKVGK
jgi:hypothetical protein